jgi:hypothetical protein
MNMMRKIMYLLVLSFLILNCSEKKNTNPLQLRNEVFQKGLIVLVENFRKPEIASEKLLTIIKDNNITEIRKKAEEAIKAKHFSEDEQYRFVGLQQSYFKMALNLKKMAKDAFLPAHDAWVKAWALEDKK